MISHHLTLEHVARELHMLINGATLVRAWSQQKGVATLVFAIGSEEMPVVIDVHAKDPSITARESAHRALRNSIDVFPGLLGQSLGAVVKLEHDRVISFIFTDDVLHVELFSGGRGNIVSCRDGIAIDALHRRTERIGTAFSTLPRVSPEPLVRGDLTLLQDLSTCSLRLAKHYAQEVCIRAGLSPSLLVEQLSSAQRESINTHAMMLVRQCREQAQYLMLTSGDDVLLSLIPLHGWQIAETYDSILEAVRIVSFRRRADRTFHDEQQRQLRTIDAQIGKVVDELDRLGLTENTIIVLWGDHGFHLGDHGIWTKHTNYEQANHIPLLISAPGITKPNSSTRQLTESVDIFPTLAELAQLPAPAGPQPIDGISLVPVLKDPHARVRDHAFHCFPKQTLGRAIRTERYRLVEWKKPGAAPDAAELELYDYELDPLETKNFAREQPEVVAKMRAILARHPEARQ